jgi:hypothetical protein
MNLSPLTQTRIEKTALDNGFDVEGPRIDGWRTFTSSQTGLRIWVCCLGDALFVVAMSRWDVCAALHEDGATWAGPLPPGASSARSAHDLPSLHRLLRRAFQLDRVLPDAPLTTFRRATATMPTTTEAERLVVRRVGQELFREVLLAFWEGRCAVTGLAVPALLRASHIKPWADCDTDAERLDVYNGLLLAPHLDATFDQGFITVQDDGALVVSEALDAEARAVLGVDAPLRVRGLTDHHRQYLPWHREHVFHGHVAVSS